MPETFVQRFLHFNFCFRWFFFLFCLVVREMGIGNWNCRKMLRIVWTVAISGLGCVLHWHFICRILILQYIHRKQCWRHYDYWGVSYGMPEHRTNGDGNTSIRKWRPTFHFRQSIRFRTIYAFNAFWCAWLRQKMDFDVEWSRALIEIQRNTHTHTYRKHAHDKIPHNKLLNDVIIRDTIRTSHNTYSANKTKHKTMN